MIEPTPTPSTLLRTGAFLARWALCLLVAAWAALIMVWGALHVLIVPRIDSWRPWVEAQASQALGKPVRIGALAARSTGLIPALDLREVDILDGQGRSALKLERVQVAISPRSLLGLGFEQLHIESPSLEIRRDREGQIWVADLPLSNTDGEDMATLDWLFSQPELAIVGGRVRWTDALRGTPAITLEQVDLVVRNRLLSHAIRLDATPPPEFGTRWTAMGRFSQSLLARHPGDWRAWKGQLYGAVDQIHFAAVRPYVEWQGEVMAGAGAIRAWVDVDHAKVQSATVDMGLRSLQVRLAPELETLDFSWIAGRAGLTQQGEGTEFFTQGLEFDTGDGLHWPGGNVRVRHAPAEDPQASTLAVQADRLDLAALARIAARLPLDASLREQLGEWMLRGVVERLEGQWQGPLQRPNAYSVTGRITGLAVSSLPTQGAQNVGLNNADLDFAVTDKDGKAHVDLREGAVQVSGVFDDGTIAFSHLRGDLGWKRNGDGLEVSIRKLDFANADAAGSLDADWRSGSGARKFPGSLDLRGTLSRAAGNRVYRYIPNVVDAEVREYLRTSIQAGHASNVRFKVKGALEHFPFLDPHQGEFRIAADVRQAIYDYAPAMVLPKNSAPWPVLRDLSTELLIDKGVLSLTAIQAGIDGVPGLRLGKAEARIVDLYAKPHLSVQLDARLPLQEGFGFLKASPIAAMTEHFLDSATGSGTGDLRLRLGIPLVGAAHPQVQGSVTLSGNDIALTPDIPRLSRVRGVVGFSESGFSVTGGQARALGGDLRAEGGVSGLGPAGTPVAKGAPSVLRITGVASAEGLRQAPELGMVARLGQFATGTAPYSVQVGLRGGRPELTIQTGLVGMALNLPPPFAKPAAQPLAVRVDTRAVAGDAPTAPALEQWQVDVERLGSVTYVRDLSTPTPTVVRGAIALGLAADESAPLPTRGVVANLQFGDLDVDAWSDALAAGDEAGAAAPGGGSALAAAQPYLPHNLAVRARSLQMGGHRISHLVLGGAREGTLWRANVDADELSGYLEYRQPGTAFAGRLYARLARLAVAAGEAQDVENLLDSQPAAIPALDIVVEDFDLRGRRLGRLDIEAVNLVSSGAREWRMNRFNLTMPEATLTAQGNWAAMAGVPSAGAARSLKERRRTVMNFKLDVADAGDLLARFGMKDVIRKGQGKLEGQIAWQGSPITLDYASMTGGANLSIENGQFLKADPGLAKLLGVLSLQALPRRLTLDFRDVFSEGFAFDFIRGDVTVAQGIARTNNLQMKGVNAAVLMEGQADIERETQSLRVVVVPEINAGSASLIASVINPVVGLTTFLAQWVLRRPLAEATTQEFLIDGSWADPKVTRVQGRAAADNDKKPSPSKESVQ